MNEHHEGSGQAAPHPNVINALIRERDGWREEAITLQRALKSAQADLDLRRAHQERDAWFFQGDGEDHIESMGNRMVVVIHASDLRRLLEAERAGKQGAAAQAPTLPDGHVAVPTSLLQTLASWRLCMSYDASYFGEPAGLLKQCVAELDRLLTAKPAAPAPAASTVPAGYKLVPVEPTPEMLAAALPGETMVGNGLKARIWREMLFAAPSTKEGNHV